MRVLITGKDGQVGWELERILTPIAEVHALGRAQLDLRDAAEIAAALRSARPDVVINAAAYTDVNKAESERTLADAINGHAPGVMAEELARHKALLIHYSTDYVFNGTSPRPYREDDPTDPINAYGASKLLGEEAITRAAGQYLIFRTEWVYATRGKNFLLTMLRLAREGKPLRVVSDQVGSPTWARAIAEATVEALTRYRSMSDPAAASGIYHLTAGGEASWFEFAKDIFSEGARGSGATADACKRALERLQPVGSAEFPTPARRPANSLLDNRKLREVFCVVCPDWREQLRRAMRELPQS